MAIGRARAVALDGVRGRLVEIEADLGQGLPKTVLVGLPDTSLHEARDRCRAAVINSGQAWPNRRILIALSPASLPKGGAQYDMGIALAVLVAAGLLPPEPVFEAVVLGELALDGRLRAVPGVLPSALAAAEAGCERLLVPEVNVAEARVVPGLTVVGVRSLRQVVAMLRGEEEPDDPPVPPLDAGPTPVWRPGDRTAGMDLADVAGQTAARWSVEVAAAGGHHLLLEGPPGAGKTMLAERLPRLLPDLSPTESLEVSAVHSVAGVLPPETPLLTRPSFVDPHHTASVASIVGGGSRVIRPGAMSLAHHGVLFMDEAPEFAAHVLEALRQPLESGQVTISRADVSATYPARFLLVLAANPCPCGQAPGPECTCTPMVMRRYRDRISGPVRDRVDIAREVLPVPRHELLDRLAAVEGSEAVADRVLLARARQEHRYADTPWRRNVDVPGPDLRARWPLPGGAVRRLEQPVRRGVVSARGLDRVARLAWTVADLAGRGTPSPDDVEAAWGLRHSDAVPLTRVQGVPA